MSPKPQPAPLWYYRFWGSFLLNSIITLVAIWWFATRINQTNTIFRAQVEQRIAQQDQKIDLLLDLNKKLDQAIPVLERIEKELDLGRGAK